MSSDSHANHYIFKISIYIIYSNFALYSNFIFMICLSLDIDECRRGLSQCKQDCNNSPGGYSCACRLGYSLDRDGITCNGKIF